MMEGLYAGPMFDSLSNNVSEIQPTVQSNANKYIIAKDLADPNAEGEGKMITKERSLTPSKLAIGMR